MYKIQSQAKVANGLFAEQAIIAGDDQSIYIIDKDSGQVTFTLPLSKVQKAYAQLGELYIKYGFGKMIVVKFVTVDAGNVVAAAASSVASTVHHTSQASAVQGDIQKWVTFFQEKNIKAKQQLSPKKFIIIAVIAVAIIFIVRLVQSL